MNLKETYNRIAHDWYNDHQTDTWWVEGTDAMCSHLAPRSTILDVGCGAGVKSKYLAAKGFRVTGIDISDKLIEIAQANSPDSEFKVLDMHDVGSLRVSFDAIFAQASLLHIPKNDVPVVLAALASVIKPGGLLYVAVKKRKDGQNEEEVVKENDYGYEYERFFSYYTMEELKDHFAKLGLTIVYENSAQFGKTTWLQIIGRK